MTTMKKIRVISMLMACLFTAGLFSTPIYAHELNQAAEQLESEASGAEEMTAEEVLPAEKIADASYYSSIHFISHPKDITVSKDTPVTFSVSVTPDFLITYQWQYKAKDGTKWIDSPADGSTTSRLSLVAESWRNGYQYRCGASFDGGSMVYSNPATLTISSEFFIRTQPQDIRINEWETAKFSVSASSGSSISYQWQYRGSASGTWTNSPAEGNKTAVLSVPATLARNGYQYRCILNSAGEKLISSPASLTVYDVFYDNPPLLFSQPVDVSVPEGDDAIFSVSASSYDLVTYQWQYKAPSDPNWYNSPAEGADSSKLRVEALDWRNGYQYRCKTSNRFGTTISNAATLKLSDALQITSHPSNRFAYTGDTVTFKVGALSGKTIYYQWQFKTPSDPKWYNATASGNKTAVLTVPVTMGRDDYQYRCKVTSGSTTLYSDAAELSVYPSHQILSHPSNVTAKEGGTATFRVQTTVTDGNLVTYQWLYRTSSAGSWKNATADGNKTAQLSVPATASRNGYQYRCKVTANNYDIFSNIATLTVSTAQKPVITAQPKNVTAVSSDKVSFSVTATGDDLSYQWQFKAPGYDWSNNSCKTKTLTINPAESWRDGYQYRCKVSNASGTVTSKAVTLLIEPEITKEPEDVTTTASGSATFTVKANGPDLEYQWQFKAPGYGWQDNTCTERTFTVSPAKAWRDGYQYRCIVSNENGSVTSDAAVLTVE